MGEKPRRGYQSLTLPVSLVRKVIKKSKKALLSVWKVVLFLGVISRYGLKLPEP
jgi:hypothetical protein